MTLKQFTYQDFLWGENTTYVLQSLNQGEKTRDVFKKSTGEAFIHVSPVPTDGQCQFGGWEIPEMSPPQTKIRVAVVLVMAVFQKT